MIDFKDNLSWSLFEGPEENRNAKMITYRAMITLKTKLTVSSTCLTEFVSDMSILQKLLKVSCLACIMMITCCLNQTYHVDRSKLKAWSPSLLSNGLVKLILQSLSIPSSNNDELWTWIFEIRCFWIRLNLMSNTVIS